MKKLLFLVAVCPLAFQMGLEGYRGYGRGRRNRPYPNVNNYRQGFGQGKGYSRPGYGRNSWFGGERMNYDRPNLVQFCETIDSQLQLVASKLELKESKSIFSKIEQQFAEFKKIRDEWRSTRDEHIGGRGRGYPGYRDKLWENRQKQRDAWMTKRDKLIGGIINDLKLLRKSESKQEINDLLNLFTSLLDY